MSGKKTYSKDGFVVLSGPTCVGKGFVARLLGERGHKTIGIGDLTRTALKDDPQFRSDYGDIVARGDLLPDKAAIALLEAELSRQLRHPRMENGLEVVIDGFGRSPGQIAYATKMGILNPRSTFFVLNATRSTCFARAVHRATTANVERPDGKRFNYRFDLHNKSQHSIVKAVQKSNTGTQIFHIDADRDIQLEVFPDLITMVLSQRGLLSKAAASQGSDGLEFPLVTHDHFARVRQEAAQA